MKYSTEPRFRKYVKGYGFWSFAIKFGIMVKINEYCPKKTRNRCCKNCI